MKPRQRTFKKQAAAVLAAIAVVSIGVMVGMSYSDTGGGKSLDKPQPPESAEQPANDAPSYSDIRIAAAGDIMFHDTQLRSGFDKGTKTYDFKSVFEGVKPIISAADLAIANFETTTGGDRSPYSGYPRFNSPDEVAHAIRYAGFDVMSTANNHSLDMGSEGLIRTVQVLREGGLDTVGTYEKRPDTRVLIKDVKGIKLAFFSYTESTNGLDSGLTPEERDSIINIVDEKKIKEDIAYAKAHKADVVIAFMHWGNEYERTPSAKQEKLAKLMVDEGVNLILGSHPHVIQKSERLTSGGNSAFVVYSLGNFISNQREETLDNAYTEDGLIVQIDIRKNEATNETVIRNVDYVPTWVYRGDSGVSGDGETFAYEILPIQQFIDRDNLSPSDKKRMQRSYDATIGQMDTTAFADLSDKEP